MANYFPRRFRPPICAANPYTFRHLHEKEAKHNKLTKPFPMWPMGSKIIAQFSKYLSGSRDPDGPDLPSLFGRKFHLSVQLTLESAI